MLAQLSADRENMKAEMARDTGAAMLAADELNEEHMFKAPQAAAQTEDEVWATGLSGTQLWQPSLRPRDWDCV